MEVLAVAGARPNFMKIAPVVRALSAAGFAAPIVHTGQHYDQKMSGSFFDELEIPAPAVNLEVGSGSHVAQIAEVMKRLEPVLAQRRPDVVLVVGDVNSTLAAAVAACKMNLPVAHVEAGLRSFDRTMPEETNRILTDSISRWLFTSEPSADENLRREGVPAAWIHPVGNVMIDTLLRHRERARAARRPASLGLASGAYALMTLHRPSNVDDPERLESILHAAGEIAAELPVLFLVHPRTAARIEEHRLAERNWFKNIRRLEPQGYLAMLGLMDEAALVLTDSGGVQEETTVLGVPCLTIRENTERPITLQIGSNRLVGGRSGEIVDAAREALRRGRGAWTTPARWDGRASERIANVLATELGIARRRAA